MRHLPSLPFITGLVSSVNGIASNFKAIIVLVAAY